MKRAQVTVLFDTDGDPPKEQDYTQDLKKSDEAEFDVAKALKQLGYRFHLLGFRDEVRPLLRGVERRKTDVVFNLTEGFRQDSALDFTVSSLLEMLGLPYTGSPPFALQLARDKAVSKKILDFHGIKVPEFAVFRQGQEMQRPSDLRFPLIVKPLLEDASLGIAQTSVVHDDKTLEERVKFIFESLYNDAIVEELIVGREMYLSILGNDPPEPLTPIEMVFQKEEDDLLKIATYRAKWSAKYRKDKGIRNVAAKDLEPELRKKINEVGLTTYQNLLLRDYARIDMRITPDNEVYVIEANPNPLIAQGEDVPLAAKHSGIAYNDLIERLVKLALERKD